MERDRQIKTKEFIFRIPGHRAGGTKTKEVNTLGLNQLVDNLVDDVVADFVANHRQVIDGAVKNLWCVTGDIITGIDVAIDETHATDQGLCQLQFKVGKTCGVKAFAEAIDTGLTDICCLGQCRDTGTGSAIRIRQDNPGHLALGLV